MGFPVTDLSLLTLLTAGQNDDFLCQVKRITLHKQWQNGRHQCLFRSSSGLAVVREMALKISIVASQRKQENSLVRDTITKRHEEAARTGWGWDRKSLRQTGKPPCTERNIKTFHTSMKTKPDGSSSRSSNKTWKRDTVSVSKISEKNIT